MTQTMRAFEIHLNGKRLCVAGMRKGIWGVTINWVARPKRSDEIGGFAVSGLIDSTKQHVKWTSRQLHVGDELRIKLVEKNGVDGPRNRKKNKAV
jgi:hypothetical protein